MRLQGLDLSLLSGKRIVLSLDKHPQPAHLLLQILVVLLEKAHPRFVLLALILRDAQLLSKVLERPLLLGQLQVAFSQLLLKLGHSPLLLLGGLLCLLEAFELQTVFPQSVLGALELEDPAFEQLELFIFLR